MTSNVFLISELGLVISVMFAICGFILWFVKREVTLALGMRSTNIKH